jgi:membrane-bound lytic murein transglycosylase D
MHNYQSMITAQLKAQHLPLDLLAIPLLESRYQPLLANNKTNTAGIWQLSSTIAKYYGLKINDKIDERINPKAATYAALTYLNDLHAEFNNWPLAITSYNAGSNVTKKLMQSPNNKIPQEVKSYLPMADAAVIIMHNPELVK